MEPIHKATLLLLLGQNDTVCIVSVNLPNVGVWIDTQRKRGKDPSFVLSSSEQHHKVTLLLLVEQNDIVCIVSLPNIDARTDIWKRRGKDPSFVLSSWEPQHKVTLLLLVGRMTQYLLSVCPTSRRRVTL